jgi:hypothetical protein
MITECAGDLAGFALLLWEGLGRAPSQGGTGRDRGLRLPGDVAVPGQRESFQSHSLDERVAEGFALEGLAV